MKIIEKFKEISTEFSIENVDNNISVELRNEKGDELIVSIKENTLIYSAVFSNKTLCGEETYKEYVPLVIKNLIKEIEK